MHERIRGLGKTEPVSLTYDGVLLLWVRYDDFE